jgi:chorismate dehydratase
MLSSGEIDLCPSSSIEYGRSFEKYMLIPELSISSCGPVKSVFLFSRMPLEELDGATICVTSESETSVALLKIILSRFYRFDNRFIPTALDETDSVLGRYPAALVIGNIAMKWAVRYREHYRYDLGEVWRTLTGLPFVFAMWIIRAATVAAKPDEVALIAGRLKEAKRLAFANMEEIAAECSERFWMDRDGLISYWKNISYDLTPLHLQGLETFFRYACEVGVLAAEPVLRFIPSKG